MLFDHRALCHMAAQYDQSGGCLGIPGLLTVLTSASGSLAVTTDDGDVAAESGAAVCFTGVGLLTDGHAIGLTLGGQLAADCAAALSAPLALYDATVVASTQLLAQASSSLSCATLDGWAYSLLCHITDADPARLPPLITKAIALMQEHFGSIYGVEGLSVMMGISKAHLVRSFSKAIGTTPGRYLTMIRIEAAKRLLLCDDLSIDTVAGLCGFSGDNYFCKVFRRATGEPPGQWRISHAKDYPITDSDRELIDRLYL